MFPTFMSETSADTVGLETHDTLVNGQALYLAELRANIS